MLATFYCHLDRSFRLSVVQIIEQTGVCVREITFCPICATCSSDVVINKSCKKDNKLQVFLYRYRGLNFAMKSTLHASDYSSILLATWIMNSKVFNGDLQFASLLYCCMFCLLDVINQICKASIFNRDIGMTTFCFI